MLYDNANEKLREEKAENKSDSSYRMATIVTTSPTVRFFGDANTTAKTYKRLSSYSPAVGDQVIMARTGSTYVILGKVV